ncbi:MAG: M23 family metallopeptidase [Synergistaceae bacterium]|nr:M23 family metallopeptidase [Synergistaceae bacterium]
MRTSSRGPAPRAALILLCAASLLATASSARAASWVSFPTSWDVGQAFAVAIESDTAYLEPTVTWMGRTIALDVEHGREGHVSYALLGSFVRDTATGEQPIVFEFTQGPQRFQVKGKIEIRPREYPKERLKVAPRMVAPSKKDQPRIKEERQLVGRALRTMTPQRRWTTPPQPPLTVMTLTSRYGFQRIYNGTPRSPHGGADLRAKEGTAVRAPFAGTVILTGFHYYAGGSVYIDSGNGVITAFFHLSRIDVEEGQRVAKGQVVARSGSTGRVTGPHLHYGLCLAGQFVDPMPLLETSVTELLKLAERAKVAD